MRYNLMLAAALISGFAFCTFFPNSELAVVFEKSEYLLYALIFAVGITIGVDKDFRDIHNVFQWRLFILPLSILSGSVAASGVVIILLTGLDPFMVLAINAGVGYYSITSIIVGNFSDGLVAAIALIVNVFREILTILLAPLLLRWFGPLSLVAGGGATAMDTTLPTISLYSGRDYIFPAVFSGMILTIIVPFIVTFFAGLGG
jgi:uncharacterized membrane protein YbjE (DUF340 family)